MRQPPSFRPASRRTRISAWAVGSLAQLALVAGRRQHLAVPHDHRADRDVVVLERALGLAQREPHVVLVAREEAVHRLR